jgi:imidazolonepropionase-like amidohydrolase
MQGLVRLLRDGGVPLTTGTDLTNPWVIPGESLHREFELLAETGLSPGEILRMTGVNAARALRRSDISMIEVGRRADLVLIRANPLVDIRNTRRIGWTMKGGHVVSDGPHVSARVQQPH